MATTIPQRDLRNHHAQVIDRVAAGESFTVTRGGVPIADVVPHVANAKPPRFRTAAAASARSRLSRAEAKAWLDDIAALDGAIEQGVRDPWENALRG